MTNDQYNFWRLLSQLREWQEAIAATSRVADDSHWLIRVEKSVLIDGLRRLADRLEKADAEHEKDAAS